MPFCAYQNDVMKNFSVVMSAVVKKVDCSIYETKIRQWRKCNQIQNEVGTPEYPLIRQMGWFKLNKTCLHIG